CSVRRVPALHARVREGQESDPGLGIRSRHLEAGASDDLFVPEAPEGATAGGSDTRSTPEARFGNPIRRLPRGSSTRHLREICRFSSVDLRICVFRRCSATVLNRTTESKTPNGANADVAQLVAHHLAKVRVAGSNPVIRSRGWTRPFTVEWPSGEATACKAVHTGSIPVSTSRD